MSKLSKSTSSTLSIKLLKTYQPVEFGPQKELHSYFTAGNPKLKGLEIEFNVEHQLIHLRQGAHHKIIFPANVQFMEPAE